jgi:hypothetical protein
MSFGKIKLCVLLLVAAIVIPYNYLKRATNFVEVDATIRFVESSCQRDGTTLGAFQNAEPAASRACSSVEMTEYDSPHPALIARTFFVSYVSPVDQKMHDGTVRRVGFLKTIKEIPTSGKLQILASRTNSNIIQSIE